MVHCRRACNSHLINFFADDMWQLSQLIMPLVVTAVPCCICACEQAEWSFRRAFASDWLALWRGRRVAKIRPLAGARHCEAIAGTGYRRTAKVVVAGPSRRAVGSRLTLDVKTLRPGVPPFPLRKTRAMSKEAPRRRSAPATNSLTPEEQLRAAREIVRREAAGVWKVSYRLSSTFCEAVKLLYTCKGSAIVTGMGKAGLIGQKIAATLSSTGTRAHFLHPAEAFHGDLGRIHPSDVVVVLTQSGETAEVVQLLPSLREFGVPLIAITATRLSTVGQAASVVIELGELEEVCSLGLAPSTSTTAMLAVGDALALVLSKMRNFQADDFARFHPGGALGRRAQPRRRHHAAARRMPPGQRLALGSRR